LQATEVVNGMATLERTNSQTPERDQAMPQLTFRKKEAVLATGGLLATGGGLLLKVLPDPFSLWAGGVVGLTGLAMVAYGTFGITTPGRIANEWNPKTLHRALKRAPAGSTIKILQTSIPDVTRLTGFLEELLVHDQKQFRLHLLLLDYEKAPEVLAARVQLRIEDADKHTQEIQSNIDQFIQLKKRVDAAWKEPMSGAQLDLRIRLYSFLPFGSVYQIGDECFISGLFWNWTSSINGPMISVSDKKSNLWKCLEKQIARGWDTARQIYPPS
jgi:hypothetical protein